MERMEGVRGRGEKTRGGEAIISTNTINQQKIKNKIKLK